MPVFIQSCKNTDSVLSLLWSDTVLLCWIQYGNLCNYSDCVEYGEWKTGVRNDGFQYAFISLGNKIGMAIGTSVLAAVLGAAGFTANAQQNETVLTIMKHSFSTIQVLFGS